jgi:hypothetical protein
MAWRTVRTLYAHRFAVLVLFAEMAPAGEVFAAQLIEGVWIDKQKISRALPKI